MKLTSNILDNISKKYGDSFYLLDSIQFKKNYNELLSAFREIYPNTCIAYSYKTNYIPKLCRIIDDLGGYAEVVSDMEYEIARRIGVKPEKIIFNGPYKNLKSIKELLLTGGTVNIDSAMELDNIEKIADANPNNELKVGIRCNFDIKDGITSRFGFDVESHEFHDVLTLLHNKANVNLIGLHCHYATRNLETWSGRVDGMLRLIDALPDFIPEYIDLGGGLFGKMQDSLKMQFGSYIPTYKEYADVAATKFAEKYKNHIKKPKLLIEPGSALAGDVMDFVTKIISIKNVRGKFIATVLGSIYNINPTLNKKNPPIVIYHNNDDNPKLYSNLDFGGYTCIESDYLYRGFNGNLSVGDYVVFGNVGSYSIVLKPPFILPNFAVVDYDDKNENIEIIKEKENFDDIFHTYKF